MANIIEKMFLGLQAAFSFTVYIRLLLSLVSKTFCFLLPINITFYSDQQYVFKCSFCFFCSIKKTKDFNANDGEWQNWTYLLSESTVQVSGCQLGWFGQNLETFLFVMIEGMGADISWIETRDNAKYHSVQDSPSPQPKIIWSQMSREPRERNFGLINVASSLQGPLLTAVHLSWSEWYAKLWGKHEIIWQFCPLIPRS